MLISDPITLYDAVGLSCEDCLLTISGTWLGSVLRISVRPELMFKVPEKISVIIDGRELLVDYNLDSDYFELAKVAKMVLHHDDPPCSVRLDSSGFCKVCKLVPDMQSTCFYFYCQFCNCTLKNLKCQKCRRVFVCP